MRGRHCLEVWTRKAASGVTVHRRERAVRHSQKRIRRAWHPERGKGLGNIVWAGCFSDDVLGQPQGFGQCETRRHAESLDTGGFQVREVRRQERHGTTVR